MHVEIGAIMSLDYFLGARQSYSAFHVLCYRLIFELSF